MNDRWSLACSRCGSVYPLGPLVTGCPACAVSGERGVLGARFDAGTSPDFPRAAGRGRFRALLPGGEDPGWHGLGEGETPLVRSRRIAAALGLERLWFKLEACNPTASFKDRYVAVSVNLARVFGFERVVVSSTGNLGVSVAAYAAALGLDCLLVALPDMPGPMLGQSLAHGARVVAARRVERQAVFEDVARRPGWFPIGLLLPRPVQNPFGVEGYRPMAWEMIHALGHAPHAVLFPCARGNGLFGAWKGFREARAWGWSDALPRMVACQPIGANSLEASLQAGVENAVELAPIESVAASAAETVADDRALAALRESGGAAASVDDATLLAATAALAREEGLAVEPSSALPVACLAALLERGAIRRDEDVVCVLTATAARWPEHLPRPAEPPPLVSPGDAALERLLARP